MSEKSWASVVGDEPMWSAHGPTVALRAVRVDDSAALYTCRERPASQRFISRIPASPQAERAAVEHDRQDPLTVRCAIVADATVVGDIGGRFVRPGSLGPDPGVWDFRLGYCVHPDHWGRGLATEAVGLFTVLLHQTFGVRRIVAKVFRDNVASARVLRRNGFRLEATEVAAVVARDGSWFDDCTFAHLPGDACRTAD